MPHFKMLLLPFHHITDTSSQSYFSQRCNIVFSAKQFLFQDVAAYSSLFVYIHKHSECVYQMNEFHPSQLLIHLAFKPSSVKTVKHNQSWTLRFPKRQLILSNAIHPMPFSTNPAWGNELARVTHLHNAGFVLFLCPG